MSFFRGPKATSEGQPRDLPAKGWCWRQPATRFFTVPASRVFYSACQLSALSAWTPHHRSRVCQSARQLSALPAWMPGQRSRVSMQGLPAKGSFRLDALSAWAPSPL